MTEDNVSQKLAAILYADVAEYSRLTESDEIGTRRKTSSLSHWLCNRPQADAALHPKADC